MPAIVAELSMSATTVVFILTFILMVTYALKSEKIKSITSVTQSLSENTLFMPPAPTDPRRKS